MPLRPAHTATTTAAVIHACFAAVVMCVGNAQALAPAQSAAPLAAYRSIAGGTISTLLPPDGKQAPVRVPRFAMRMLPVTQAEFARFALLQPQWRRSRAASSSLADSQYLGQWPTDTAPNIVQSSHPVTDVSWFAAAAYCHSEGARLPTWHEWEYAAAADGKRRDARKDPVWRARILDWYGQTSKSLPTVGSTKPNLYGIQDLHGVIWEWVDDAGALMVSGDNRTQGDPDTLKFCGAGALSATDRENYPILMRIAMLSSLGAASTNRNLGFRCVKDLAGVTK
jgi:formylglycine-generating enzyme